MQPGQAYTSYRALPQAFQSAHNNQPLHYVLKSRFLVLSILIVSLLSAAHFALVAGEADYPPGRGLSAAQGDAADGARGRNLPVAPPAADAPAPLPGDGRLLL